MSVSSVHPRDEVSGAFNASNNRDNRDTRDNLAGL